jgi:hypothetical protein
MAVRQNNGFTVHAALKFYPSAFEFYLSEQPQTCHSQAVQIAKAIRICTFDGQCPAAFLVAYF